MPRALKFCCIRNSNLLISCIIRSISASFSLEWSFIAITSKARARKPAHLLKLNAIQTLLSSQFIVQYLTFPGTRLSEIPFPFLLAPLSCFTDWPVPTSDTSLHVSFYPSWQRGLDHIQIRPEVHMRAPVQGPLSRDDSRDGPEVVGGSCGLTTHEQCRGTGPGSIKYRPRMADRHFDVDRGMTGQRQKSGFLHRAAIDRHES